MTVEIPVGARCLSPRNVSAIPEEPIFAIHELLGIFLDFFIHSRVIVQKILKMGMLRQELRVVYERGVLIQLMMNPGMIVQVLVKIPQLPAVDVIILRRGGRSSRLGKRHASSSKQDQAQA